MGQEITAKLEAAIMGNSDMAYGLKIWLKPFWEDFPFDILRFDVKIKIAVYSHQV